MASWSGFLPDIATAYSVASASTAAGPRPTGKSQSVSDSARRAAASSSAKRYNAYVSWHRNWSPHDRRNRHKQSDPRTSRSLQPAADTGRVAAARQPRAAQAREGAGRGRAEPGRGPDHDVRGLDDVRVHPHPVVRLLDRVRRREVPLRPADDDRLARGDLPLDLRNDQPEPR